MDADDFVRWYWAVDATAHLWSTLEVSINTYKIGKDESGPKYDARQAVFNAAQRQQLAPNRLSFFRANYGKVSPNDCSHILSLAIQTGTVKEDNIQRWADTNLGCDCTGFTVAYFDECGWISLDKYSGGIGCALLLHKAKLNNRGDEGGPLIWDLGDVCIDDFIIWMDESGKETRTPGHISVIYDIDYDLGILYCGESNGSKDDAGHQGPRLTERKWKRVKQGYPRYVELEGGAQVMIVRPTANFG